MSRSLLVLSLLLAALSAGAVPSEFLTAGDGSYYNPYRLSSAQHIAELDKEVRGGRTFAGEFLVLAADIDMSQLPEWLGKFSGIGEAAQSQSASASFCGDFNGRHFTIRNLAVNAASDTGTGLFNSVGPGAYIHHLILDESCSVRGGNNTAAIAGCVWDGLIEFCASEAAVRGSRNVGGIVGSIHSGAIQHCANSGRIDAVKGVGGIVGLMDGTTSVTGCYNTGVVAASTFGACAGIAGQGYGYADISACYNTGLVSGRRSVEFDIELSNILSDRPPVVWKGEIAGCCAVSSLSEISEEGVMDFMPEAFRTDEALNFLNDALRASSFISGANSTAVISDRLFTFASGRNEGFPVIGWELQQPDSALPTVVTASKTFEINGCIVRSLSGNALCVFDLAGRRIGEGPEVFLAPGVYLINNVKILIR